MTARERTRDKARRRADATLDEIVGELRGRRQQLGLSQAVVAEAAGVSQPMLSRIERGERRSPSLGDLWSIGAVLGLDLRLSAYPGGEPVHDHVQLRLLEAIRARTSGAHPWLLEVPLPIEGDRRAWDSVWAVPDGWTAFEAVSRFGAVDATVRALRQKQRDDPRIRRVVLVVADTWRNRAAIDAARPLLAPEFPLLTRDVLRDLGAGRAPRADGIARLRLPSSPKP